MSNHKLLAVGAAGAIGYMFYRWSSIPDTAQGTCIYILSSNINRVITHSKGE